ncbi:MAG: BRO family protein [Saprospiraceae bacterium]
MRRTWYNEEWWFSVSDVVEVLTETKDVRQYIKKMRKRDETLNSNWETICTLLQLIAKDGKKRKTNCANTEGIFRIIQSVTSPKAEPFKQWLAKVGYERIQEIENPELAAERARQYYRDLGYTDDWIERRLQTIQVRSELTRHIAVDCLGLPMALHVSAANCYDGKEGRELLWQLAPLKRLKTIAADGTYKGQFEKDAQWYNWTVEITQKPPTEKGFVPQSSRWQVERNFGWFNFFRRLNRDFEKTEDSSVCFMQLAFITIILTGIDN